MIDNLVTYIENENCKDFTTEDGERWFFFLLVEIMVKDFFFFFFFEKEIMVKDNLILWNI